MIGPCYPHLPLRSLSYVPLQTQLHILPSPEVVTPSCWNFTGTVQKQAMLERISSHS